MQQSLSWHELCYVGKPTPFIDRIDHRTLTALLVIDFLCQQHLPEVLLTYWSVGSKRSQSTHILCSYRLVGGERSLLSDTVRYYYNTVQYIKNNAWVTVNNVVFFWSRVRWFANDFHEWQSHGWKSLANHLTSDQKIFIHGNECIIIFLARYFIYWTHHSPTNKHRSLILLTTVFSDFTLWRHHNWSVTSREREALALWRHIHRLFLHTQVGPKAIFTSEYQPWISISHHPVFTA